MIPLLLAAALGWGSSPQERPGFAPEELQALRDSNLFSPRRKRPAPPPKKPPLVTGIFLDPKSSRFVVVLEGADAGPRFLQSGDEAAGFQVRSVGPEGALFEKAGVARELRVGDPLR